jgi:hypothetical protein
VRDRRIRRQEVSTAVPRIKLSKAEVLSRPHEGVRVARGSLATPSVAYHLDVGDRRPLGVLELRTHVAQGRGWRALYKHLVAVYVLYLRNGDGPLARTPLAQIRVGSF